MSHERFNRPWYAKRVSERTRRLRVKRVREAAARIAPCNSLLIQFALMFDFFNLILSYLFLVFACSKIEDETVSMNFSELKVPL